MADFSFPTQRITEVDLTRDLTGAEDVYIKQGSGLYRTTLAQLLLQFGLTRVLDSAAVPVPQRLVTVDEYAAMRQAGTDDPNTVYVVYEEG